MLMASVNYKELVSVSISTCVALKKVSQFFNHLRSFIKIDTQQFIRSPIDNRTYVRFEGTKVPKGKRERERVSRETRLAGPILRQLNAITA